MDLLRRPRFPLCICLASALAALSGACNAPGEADVMGIVTIDCDPTLPYESSGRRLQDDVVWLADDAREGRRSGEPGNASSAEWIAARLASLGLEPAGESGGWFQSFDVPLPPRDGGESMIQRDWETEGFVQSVVWLSADDGIAPLFCSEGGEAIGQLVFRGYGIQNAEHSWDDYGGSLPADAIALVVRGTPPLPEAAEPASADSDTGVAGQAPGWGSSGSIFTKVMLAKRHGAKAVIVAEHPSRKGEPVLAFDAGQSARAGVPALFLTAEAAERLLPIYASLVENVDRGDGLISPRIGAVTVSADVQRATGRTRNVLGLVRGRDPARTVAIGAHFDHLGRGGSGSLDPKALGSIHNGADDNASGTATVLEIARQLAEGTLPAGDVLIALWSGEEEGLLGSEHWAARPTIPLERVRANLNLDMVGRAGNGRLQVLGAGSSPAFAAWMEPAGADAGLELAVSLSGQGLGGSDHQSFLKREIPALHLFSGVHPDYHRPTDDAERVEIAGMARVAALSLGLLGRMQAAPELPWSAPKIEEAPAGAEPRAAGWRAWFGSVPDYAYDGRGLLLSGTSPGSPAERGGFLKGDVVTRMGDVAIDNIYDFVHALQVYQPGNVIAVEYLRDGKSEVTRVTLSTREVQ